MKCDGFKAGSVDKKDGRRSKRPMDEWTATVTHEFQRVEGRQLWPDACGINKGCGLMIRARWSCGSKYDQRRAL